MHSKICKQLWIHIEGSITRQKNTHTQEKKIRTDAWTSNSSIWSSFNSPVAQSFGWNVILKGTVQLSVIQWAMSPLQGEVQSLVPHLVSIQQQQNLMGQGLPAFLVHSMSFPGATESWPQTLWLILLLHNKRSVVWFPAQIEAISLMLRPRDFLCVLQFRLHYYNVPIVVTGDVGSKWTVSVCTTAFDHLGWILQLVLHQLRMPPDFQI